MTKSYMKEIEELLKRKYIGMRSRSCDPQYPNIPLEDLCSKRDFMAMGRNSRTFTEMYNRWVKSNYDQGLTPSVDRIDSDRGYALDNIQFLTVNENCSKGDSEETRRDLELRKPGMTLFCSSIDEASNLTGKLPSMLYYSLYNDSKIDQWKVTDMDKTSNNANTTTPVFAVRMEKDLIKELNDFVSDNALVKKDVVESALKNHLLVLRKHYDTVHQKTA